MRTYQLAFTHTVVIIHCSECSSPIAMDPGFQRQRRNDHGTFYCPAGHSQHYPGKSDAEKEREAREQAEQRLAWMNTRRIRAEQDAESHRRSAAAYKGQVTKLRRRVADGICPVPTCRRTFANVARHVEGQHPDYLHDHPALKEALGAPAAHS